MDANLLKKRLNDGELLLGTQLLAPDPTLTAPSISLTMRVMVFTSHSAIDRLQYLLCTVFVG